MLPRRALLLLLLAAACSVPVLDPPADWRPADELNARLPEPVRVYVLREERLRLRAWLVRADLSADSVAARVVVADDADRRETVSSLARQSGACVAVNGGFFTRDTEVARHDGLLRVDGELVEATRDRAPVLGFDELGRPVIAWLDAGAGDQGQGAVEPLRELLQAGPPLVADGLPLPHPDPQRHPRTAAGLTAAGELVLLVVDGRQLASRGATLGELAELMAEAGCVEALNLDGGGSTTLVVAGEVVNRPSDGAEREVMSAVALVCRP